ncbi:MAG: tetratricopeptide repeat protein [Kiritimatiellae bacterium]|nr:tetratricopeptide repeat protein [Kiritimatiellia bacterium]
MKTVGKHTIGILLGAAVTIGALIVFGATLSPWAYPGESANLITQCGGLFPLKTPDLPLWRGLFQLAWALPFGSAVVRVSALSVLFGAIGVGLLYHLVSTGILRLVNPSDLPEKQGVIISRVAGVVAAIGLCFSSPYWVVATRAHNAAFDVALLLGAMIVLMTYARSRGSGWLYLLSFIWGIGTVEYASFIILAPLVILTVLLLMWHKGQFRTLPIVTALSCGLLGLSLYLVAAWCFYGTEGYEICGYPSYFKVIWFMWRDQYRLITRSLPREGWLLILLTTGVPWLVGLGVVRKGINDEPAWSDYLLHVVLSLVCGIVLLNLGIAPWSMLGHARLLVLPYVLTAALTGYLAAYWFRQSLAWGVTPNTRLRSLIVRASAILLLLALTCVVATAPYRNYGSANSTGTGVLNECAQTILDAAAEGDEGRDRLLVVTDGQPDDLLKIVAHKSNQPLDVVDLSAGGDAGYRRYVATLFDSARLRNLARIGLMPLLNELLTSNEGLLDRTVVFAAPDIWTMVGAVPVPDRLVSRGVKSLDNVDLDELYDKHLEFWDSVVPRLQTLSESKDFADPAAWLASRLIQQASLMANNLGVCSEDKGGSVGRAYACYSRALAINPNNVSALLNMNRMMDQGYDAQDADELRSSLAELKASDRRYDVLALSRVYGYVREPEAFSGIAHTWALTGQPRMAAQSIQKAMGLVGVEEQDNLKADLAGLYLGQRRDEESEALYYELLVENPDNKRALMGLARVAALKESFDEGRSLLAKAQSAGVPSHAIAMERAVHMVLQSDDAGARKELEALVKADERRIMAWGLLIDILVRSADWPALERSADRLRNIEGGSGLAAELNGLLALRDADLVGARRYYAEALTTQPGKIPLLEKAMKLDLASGDLVAAENRARAILELDIGHALANYVVGAARLAERDAVLAEDALKRSIERERLPQALNDLAWLLLQKQQYAEAEGLAREAVQLRPEMHQALDTLGEILLKQGKLTEAEEALQKALSLASDVGTFLHMAQLQAAKGDKEHAREIVLMIADRTGRLSSEAKADYDRLRHDLGEG